MPKGKTDILGKNFLIQINNWVTKILGEKIWLKKIGLKILVLQTFRSKQCLVQNAVSPNNCWSKKV